MKIEFVIPGQPQGKARAKITRHGAYTPEKTVLYENLIKMCYQYKTPNYYTEKPLHITIEAIFEPVKSASKVQRQAMLNGLIQPTKKPDIDNIAKVILDSLNGIAYKDDTQVISLTLNKKYGEVGKVKVKIEEVVD